MQAICAWENVRKSLELFPWEALQTEKQSIRANDLFFCLLTSEKFERKIRLVVEKLVLCSFGYSFRLDFAFQSFLWFFMERFVWNKRVIFVYEFSTQILFYWNFLQNYLFIMLFRQKKILIAEGPNWFSFCNIP